MQTIISKIKERAKKEKKKIVLPESEDVRVLKAASIASLENIAEIILIGDKNKIKEICIKENIDLDNSKIFNEYNYGSYLMLRGIKVFVDSRADLYLEEFNKDCHIFEDFIYLDDNYDEIFKKYGVTHVLLSNENKVHKYMKNDNGYKKLYKDSNFTIYEVLN